MPSSSFPNSRMHALGGHARQIKPPEPPETMSASKGFGEIHTPNSNPALLKQENSGYSAQGQESHTLTFRSQHGQARDNPST
jgi:hypothetical protein